MLSQLCATLVPMVRDEFLLYGLEAARPAFDSVAGAIARNDSGHGTLKTQAALRDSTLLWELYQAVYQNTLKEADKQLDAGQMADKYVQLWDHFEEERVASAKKTGYKAGVNNSVWARTCAAKAGTATPQQLFNMSALKDAYR